MTDDKLIAELGRLLAEVRHAPGTIKQPRLWWSQTDAILRHAADRLHHTTQPEETT